MKQIQNNLQNEFISKVLKTNEKNLKNADFFYQVTFCQTKYCHRFINFEIDMHMET